MTSITVSIKTGRIVLWIKNTLVTAIHPVDVWLLIDIESAGLSAFAIRITYTGNVHLLCEFREVEKMDFCLSTKALPVQSVF